MSAAALCSGLQKNGKRPLFASVFGLVLTIQCYCLQRFIEARDAYSDYSIVRLKGIDKGNIILDRYIFKCVKNTIVL